MNVELTHAEIVLIRAGLAAHAQLMDDILYKPGTTEHDRQQARNQRNSCRELSERLGEVQIAAAMAEEA